MMMMMMMTMVYIKSTSQQSFTCVVLSLSVSRMLSNRPGRTPCHSVASPASGHVDSTTAIEKPVQASSTRGGKGFDPRVELYGLA